jgi:Tol biopolymer transport system component
MSSSTRYERRLPELLDELAAPRTPAYFDDILGQVGRTRQRPGWTFPERWLPMSALTQRLSAAPRVPLRAVAVAALLLIALAIGLALLAGSQQPRVPAPFGPARNGNIAFVDADGAIRVAAPLDRTSAVIVAGTGHDRPVFSPDGTQVAYLQANPSGTWDVVVAASDGASPVVITKDPIVSVGHLGWTPDGQSVVADIPPSMLMAIDIAPGSAPRMLSSTVDLDNFNNNLTDLFRPPSGGEILFVGSGPQGMGLYRQSISGGKAVAIIAADTSPVPFSNLAGAQWSPDGTRIAFTLHPTDNPDLGRAWLINADGTGLRRLSTFEEPGRIVDEEHLSWAPDGTRIAFGRWIQDVEGVNVDVRPVTVVDVASGDEREVGPVQVNGYVGWTWSPDGTSILEVGNSPSPYASKIIAVDAATGAVTSTGFVSDAAPTWQREASAAP